MDGGGETNGFFWGELCHFMERKGDGWGSALDEEEGRVVAAPLSGEEARGVGWLAAIGVKAGCWGGWGRRCRLQETSSDVVAVHRGSCTGWDQCKLGAKACNRDVLTHGRLQPGPCFRL